MALEVILRLDVGMDTHPLSGEERDLRARLKRKIIELAVLERQASRIVSLKEGDANTRFFHLRMNARQMKFIQRLSDKDGSVCALRKNTLLVL